MRTAGYKWLKYVPNGILRTAQAAEWKVQAWMIGKPPTLSYEGIGYDARSPSPASPQPRRGKSAAPQRRLSLKRARTNPAAEEEAPPRQSMESHFSSDFDDLRDFDGRFESRSTLGATAPSSTPASIHGRSSLGENVRAASEEKQRVPSKSFLRRLKRSPSQPSSPGSYSAPGSPVVHPKKLKGLRSMGSLKGRSASSGPITVVRRDVVSTPQLPRPPVPHVGLGLDTDVDWASSLHSTNDYLASPVRGRPISSDTTNSSSNTSDTLDWHHRDGATPPITPRHKSSEIASVSDRSSCAPTKRSLSFCLPQTSPSTVSTSPMTSVYGSPYAKSPTLPPPPPPPGISYQATLGNALIAASHAESAKGTHSDFLQILNHDNRPWGFQYANYPHKVRVWYGDKDEKIAENAVRWMERNMGEDKCQVKVVKGADHALMYRSAVVIEVLERIREHARAGEWHISRKRSCAC